MPAPASNNGVARLQYNRCNVGDVPFRILLVNINEAGWLKQATIEDMIKMWIERFAPYGGNLCQRMT